MTPDNRHFISCFKIYLLSSLFLLACLPVYSQQKSKESQLKVLRRMTNADSTAVLAKKLIDSAKKNHNQPFEARVLLAQAYQAYGIGNEKDALAFGRKAVQQSAPADTVTYVKSATMVAYMLSRQGKNVEALNVAFGILKACETHGWKKQGIDVKLCLADIYRVIKNVKQALPYAQQAAKDALSLKDTGSYIFALSNISNIVTEVDTTATGDEKGAKILEETLQPRYKKFVDDFTRSRYLGNLARLYIRQQRNELAINTLNESMDIARKGNYTSLQKHNLNELMTLYRYKKDYKQAIRYGEQAIAVEPGLQSSVSLQRNIYNQLSQSYRGVNDYKNALKYADLYHALNDSITALETARIANELDKKYSADKRLLIADNQTKLIAVQRNYIVAITLLILIATGITYAWFISKKKREATLLAKEHKQLEKLDALKTRFFANISHELRTPLTLILDPVNQLLNNPGDDREQQTSYLATISRNSKKLLNMVNELLDLGKLESGKLTLKLKPVALAALVKVIYQGFSSAAEYKKISYQLICDINESLFAELDEDKFEKICSNLVSNAVKFTPVAGAVTVTAQVNQDTIWFQVANTGGGIHPDDAPHIFDRYYQGRGEGDALEGGTGIGLAITREFTLLMGGQITIDNNGNTGTAFNVSIPLVIVPNNGPNVLKDTLTPPVNLPKNILTTDKQTILLVEDQHEMAAYIMTILTPLYNLVTALNGADALLILQTMHEQPSLIISDVMMPEMDGFTLLRKLKDSTLFFNIPVIMLTALADNQSKLTALHTGVDDYITKPFMSSELIARASNLINNAAARTLAHKQESDELRETDTTDIKNETQPLSPADMAWLAEIETLLRTQVGKTDLNLTTLSYDLAVSERQLFRRIKNITGLTPNKYIRAIRLQIAREAIESGKYRTVAEISYAAGFDTPTYFSKLFKEQFGRDVSELL